MKYLSLSALLNLSQSIQAAPSPHAAPSYPDCPPGIIPTPSYGAAGGVFSICATIDISAPQIFIYNILKNFDGYPNWNSFVTTVTKTSSGPYGVDTTMKFTNANLIPLPIPIPIPSSERISVWDKSLTNTEGFNELHVAWRLDTDTPEALHAEHLTIVRDLQNGMSRVVSLETFYGPGAAVVGISMGFQLRQNFERQNLDLKIWAEKGNTT